MTFLSDMDEQEEDLRLLNSVKAALVSARPAEIHSLFPQLVPPPSNEKEIDAMADAGAFAESTISSQDAEEILRSLGQDGSISFDDMGVFVP